MRAASSTFWPFLVAAALVPLATATWERQLEPKLFIEEYPHQLVRVFPADNITAVPGEYLRLLLLDGDYVLVGGRNYLYNLSIHTLDQVRPRPNGALRLEIARLELGASAWRTL